jgi:hypothetical protein
VEGVVVAFVPSVELILRNRNHLNLTPTETDLLVENPQWELVGIEMVVGMALFVGIRSGD